MYVVAGRADQSADRICFIDPIRPGLWTLLYCLDAVVRDPGCEFCKFCDRACYVARKIELDEGSTANLASGTMYHAGMED